MKIEVGPERMILSDGLQPFLVASKKGTLFVQGQLSFPPGYRPPAENAFPGLPGNVISRDGGKTWQRWRYQPPEEKSDKAASGNYWDSVTTSGELGPTIEGTCVGLRDGAVLIVDWIAAGPDEGGYFEGKLWETNDEFETLEGPFAWRIHLPQAVAALDDGGHPFRGICMHRSIVEMPGGELLAPIYCWFKGDEAPVGYRKEMWKMRCILVRSTDRARSWEFVTTIAFDPSVGEEGFTEPVMARVSRGPHAGRLVCHMRTGSNDFAVYQSHSDDEGLTWATPHPLPFHGVDPDLIETLGGTLIGIIGRRINGEKQPERCYQVIASRDAGESWELLARWNTEPWSSVDNTTYYASICETTPGKLLAVFDVGFWGHPIRYLATRDLTLTEPGA